MLTDFQSVFCVFLVSRSSLRILINHFYILCMKYFVGVPSNVFLTIHTLVYVITFVLCHHLYLDVCVSTSTEFIKIACILLYQISYRKLQIMKFFLCCVFYSAKNISKTCITFCWYCFGRDIGMLITYPLGYV